MAAGSRSSPLAIRRLIASGRRAREQPNVGREAPSLNVRFWALVVLTGIAAGLFGDLMMLILHTLQHLSYQYRPGDDFQSAVIHSPPWRRVATLAIGGAFAGVAWYLLRRFTSGGAELDDALWTGDSDVRFPRSLGTSVFSEVVVGMGASLGREAAPKQMGAAAGSLFARWAKLTPAQRRLIVACGGGAGMAAVYNVPLGGALMAAEILYGSISLPVVLPALVTSFIATAVSWISLPIQSTYLDVPAFHLHTSQVVWALLVGPVFGLASVGFVRLIGWASARQVKGKGMLFAPLVPFAVLGALAVAYPQLLGNGKDMAHQVFLGKGGLLLFLALFALKPLVTSACLGSGATGGLFTPIFSTGAMLGGFLGLAWSQLWPGTPVGAYAAIGAAAMSGAGMQAPLTGLVLVLELTRTTGRIMVPMIAATAIATVVARLLDGYSIYSARLPRKGPGTHTRV